MSYHATKSKVKRPVPRYHYKLATLSNSKASGRFERALRERLDGAGLSFFAICHQNGKCDVMCDSGMDPLDAHALRNARRVATEIKEGVRPKLQLL